MNKRMCRVCSREISENPLTGNLRAHKISDSAWKAISSLPNLDGRCPGK
jgi:hypothetical protein